MIINCEVVKDLLPLYHDDVVSDITKKIVSEHLKECEYCKKEYQSICKSMPKDENINTDEMFMKMMKKQRNIKILISSLVAVVIFSIWFFSHSLTAKQALDDGFFRYNEIIASYNVDGDEVFFTKTDTSYSSQVVEKKGMFYNSKTGSFQSPLEKDPDLRANFFTSYDERTDIITAMVIAWEDVVYVEFDDKFLDKTVYDDYILFYGYSIEYTSERPILYDEDFNEIDYYTN